MEETTNGGGGIGMFALGLLVGAAAGVAIGMLYAPMVGTDARRKVAEGSRDLSERARELGNTARDFGTTVRDQANRVARTVRREGDSMSEDVGRA